MAVSKEFAQQLASKERFVLVERKVNTKKWNLSDDSYTEAEPAIEAAKELSTMDTEAEYSVFDKKDGKVLEIFHDGEAQAVTTPAPEEKPKKGGKLAKAKQDAKKDVKPAKKEAPSIELWHPAKDYTAGDKISIPVSNLVKLSDTPIPFSKYAVRPLDKDHIESMFRALEAGETLPAITVQLSDKGAIVLDGNHRWAALLQFIDAHSIDEEHLKENLGKAVIDVELTDFTPRQCIEYAFQANDTNGLAMKQEFRSYYGVWLIEDAKSRGEKMSMRQAEIIAKCSHQAISKTAKKIADKQKVQLSEILAIPEEAEQVAEELQETEKREERSTLESTTSSIFVAMRRMLVVADDPEALGQYFAESGIVKPSDEAGVRTLNKALAKLLMNFPQAIEE